MADAGTRHAVESHVKILIDMNLTPQWVTVFASEGWESIHWSDVGSPTARDVEIMEWARRNECIVFTHDLDFSTILGVTNARGPSVIQLRGNDVLPDALAARLIGLIRRFEPELMQGAIVVLDEARSRIRLLPLRPPLD